MAEQLLHPTPLFQNVRSGVFLSGIRRVGKTTFLRQDLIPTLEARGGHRGLRRPLGRSAQEHGVYIVADPFVRTVWLQQERLTLPIQGAPPTSSDQAIWTL